MIFKYLFGNFFTIKPGATCQSSENVEETKGNFNLRELIIKK